MVKYFSLKLTLFLIAIDTALVVGALLVATWLRLNLPFGAPGPTEAFIPPLPVYFIAIIIYAATFALLDVRNPYFVAHPAQELQATTSASALAWLVFLGALYLTFRTVSRLQIIYFFGLHLLFIIISRLVLRLLWFERRRRNIDMRNVLVVGTNGVAKQMFSLVKAHIWSGLCPVGMVALEDSNLSENPHTIGALSDIEDIIQQHHVNEVVIAVERNTQLDFKTLMRRLQSLPVNIRLVPQYTDLAFLQVNVENFSGMPLLTLKEPVLTPYQRLMKRSFDIVVTLAIMIVALPLMGVIALLIRLDSPGGVIFQQKRIGEGGRPFTMYKFRSMVQDAEWQQEEILRYDQQGNLIHKHPEDPRVTRVGRVLRQTSLDELPQLFNILRGDMSLVGPRPEMPFLVDRYEEWQRKRFEVPQGLTGWWQVNGRASKPMHLSTDYDLFYIRNYSIWLDLQILWRTIWVVLTKHGAF